MRGCERGVSGLATMMRFDTGVESVVGGVPYPRDGELHPVPDALVSVFEARGWAHREAAVVHPPRKATSGPSEDAYAAPTSERAAPAPRPVKRTKRKSDK